jgi:predicted ester cyclase
MDPKQVEVNKRAMRRVFEEAFNEGRLDVVDECVSSRGVDRHPFAEDEPDFPAHLKAAIAMLRGVLPDLHMSVDDLIGENDRVAARVTLTGTHTGEPFFGIEPTGRAVHVEQFHIVAFGDDGLGLVHWANVGIDQLVSQLTA